MTGHQVFVQHDFNDDWAIQAGFSHRDSSINGISTEARFLLADGRSLMRQRRSRDYSGLDLSGRFELLGRLRVGGLVHRLLVGADAYRFIDRRKQYRVAEASVIDIYAPVYGQVAPPMPLTTWTREAQRSRSVYGQDQIDLSPQWKMLLGVRRHRGPWRRWWRPTTSSCRATPRSS